MVRTVWNPNRVAIEVTSVTGGSTAVKA